MNQKYLCYSLHDSTICKFTRHDVFFFRYEIIVFFLLYDSYSYYHLSLVRQTCLEMTEQLSFQQKLVKRICHWWWGHYLLFSLIDDETPFCLGYQDMIRPVFVDILLVMYNLFGEIITEQKRLPMSHLFLSWSRAVFFIIIVLNFYNEGLQNIPNDFIQTLAWWVSGYTYDSLLYNIFNTLSMYYR